MVFKSIVAVTLPSAQLLFSICFISCLQGHGLAGPTMTDQHLQLAIISSPRLTFFEGTWTSLALSSAEQRMKQKIGWRRDICEQEAKRS